MYYAVWYNKPPGVWLTGRITEGHEKDLCFCAGLRCRPDAEKFADQLVEEGFASKAWVEQD